MIQGVIFDIDGTLVDSVDLHAEAWQRTLARWGHEHPVASLRSQIGKGGDELLPTYLSEAEIAQDGEAIKAERDALFKAEYLHRVRPFPGVRPLFERLLRQGLLVALGSSGKTEEVAHHRRLTDIDGLRIEQTCSDDAERAKPHPDIFLAALKRLGLPGSATVAIGDTPYDAEAAVKAGITPVGVLCGGFPAADLVRAGCVALYRDPEDLQARFAVR